MTQARVLIVEDEFFIVQNLRNRLEELGYEVPAVALSGEEALQRAAETRPDLVLMDIKLPGELDGIAVAEDLRARFDIPVVYMTGYADDRTLQRAKITEPYGYVLKPFDVRELHSIIEMALHKHAIERKLRESEEKYRSLVEHSLQGIMIVQGLPLCVLFANAPCAELSGYPIEELLSLSPEEALALVHPEDLPLLLDRLADHLAGGQAPPSGEFRVIRKDRTVRWAEYHANLVEYEGQPAIQVGFLDITERKRVQKALQQAHEKLERQVEERTAELARINALLREEISQRWEIEGVLQRRVKELDVLNDVGRRVSASLSLDQVVASVLEVIANSIQPDLVILYFCQGDSLLVQGVHPPSPEFKGNNPLHRASQRLCGRTASERRPLYISDAHTDGSCALGECREAGIHAYAALPLCKGDEVLGVLGLTSVTERDFGQQAAFLEALAGELAMGLDNILLYGEVQRRAAELEREVADRRRAEEELVRQAQDLARANRLISALNQVSAHIQTTLDPDKVLETLGTELQALDMTCAVTLLAPEARELTIHYASLEPTALAEAEELWGSGLHDQSIPCEAWPFQEVVDHRQAVYVPDALAATAPLLADVPETLLREAIQVAGMPTEGPAVCLPLAVEEQVTGVLIVWGRDLQEADVPALSVFAAQVAIAFERARLTREAAEAEILREVDRLRSELIANVSHELRTPLGLIEVCCTSLLVDDVDFDQDTQRSFLVGIKEETDRLKAIVDNLLNLSRLESGHWRLDRQPTNLGDLIKEVMEAMQPQITTHRLIHDFPPSPLVANLDPRQIQQVLTNLLSNAIKYSPEGGAIRVEGRRDEGQAVICVHDEGVGIPAGEQERVFERFYRVDNECTQVVSGAGLGLAVCRGIVESHGGRIWVEHSTPAGSTFCFTLPIDAEGRESCTD